MIARALVAAACMFGGSLYLTHATRLEPVPLREPLSSMPMTLPGWQGASAPPMAANELAVLGVDEYITRVYQRPRTSGVGLYVGYYKSQRNGTTVHSPLNCLPGAGWEPVDRTHAVIDVADTAGQLANRSIEVNRVLVQKGLDRLLVMYWYQSHDRVVASEYLGRAFLVLDAIRMNRTDGAMVRVIAPVQASDPHGEQAASDLVTGFVKTIFPLLGRYLPA